MTDIEVNPEEPSVPTSNPVELKPWGRDLLMLGVGIFAEAALVFFVHGRPQWGWPASTPMLCLYGCIIGALLGVAAGTFARK